MRIWFREMYRLPALAVLIAVALAAPQARADEEPNLLGNWVVKPFRWKAPSVSVGCLYKQWVVIEKKIGPGRYTGTSRQQTECKGIVYPSKTKVTITVKGRTVIISSKSPSWLTETLDYVSPTLMKGRDVRGHIMIYERPNVPSA
jgi:hypothetical protein